jgi:DNA (cytosine-5)-methyltransferase 1
VSGLTLTDMFCGAGGSSIGATSAGAELRMALNHWDRAIETHATNFPHADHDCTDISATNPRRYPRTNMLAASPECTNHSLAKGAKRKGLSQFDAFLPITDDPAAERSRATMWDVPRFAEFHRYDTITVENVTDIRHWEPYSAWLQAMHCLGYLHREVFLNSMFAHPTPQSRDRIYIVFWKKGNRAPNLEIEPRAWCTRCTADVDSIQSWKNPNKQWGRYRQQYVYRCPRCATEVTPYYYAALNAIDWTIPAKRIGDRVGHEILRPRTMDRILYGLNKYGRTPMVITGRYTSGVDCRVRDAVTEPMPTQPGDPSHAVLLPFLVDMGFGGRGEKAAAGGADPLSTQTTRHTRSVVIPPSLMMYYRSNGGGDYSVDPLTDPARTFVGSASQAYLVINGSALMSMRDSDNGYPLRQVTDPLPTQVATCTQDFLIQRTPYLVSYYGTNNGGSVVDAMGALSTRDRHALVQQHAELDSVDDCYFRMLVDTEIGKGMAFPETYRVLGTKRERVKQYGNAVTPPAQEILTGRCIDSLEAA